MKYPSQKKELDRWLYSPDSDTNEKFAAIRTIYSEIGIFELMQTKMNAYYDKAFSLLEALEVREEGKEALKKFLQKLMRRKK